MPTPLHSLRSPLTVLFGANLLRLLNKQRQAACALSRVDADSCEVEFPAPQWAITPGQSVVIYESEVCLGGGIIQV